MDNDEKSIKSQNQNSEIDMENEKNIQRNTIYGNGETHPVFYIMVLVVVVASLVYYYFNPIDPN